MLSQNRLEPKWPGFDEGRKLQQFLSVWNALNIQRRVVVALTTISVIALVLILARAASTPSMALLYSGLDPSVSGDVIGALEQRGVAYSVQGNAIYVDSAQRDLTRMALAEEGLPSTGSAGYEFLDNLTGFGTTAQMFDTAYWRAKEGELARTILAWPQVKSARVHIASPVQRPFSQSADPVASVTLKITSGRLSTERARALRFLIASAVSGLSPNNVSVIDSDRGIISSQDSAYSDANTKTALLKSSVERLLAARVGVGNAIVEVAIETTLEQETIVERRFDPDSRVAISTDTQEISGDVSGNGDGSVTVASNLPDGDAQGAGTSSKSTSSETRERINYEVSETTREVIRKPGKLNRLSVAVLVNNLINVGADGLVTQSPRSEEELAALKSLVETAVGFDATRGDTITLESLDFQALPESGTLASASIFAGLAANTTSLLQAGLLTMVILGLGLFVIRPILSTQQLPLLSEPAALAANAQMTTLEPSQQLGLSGPDGTTEPEITKDPIEHLRQIISDRQEESAEVLRNWIETSEGPAA
jgi:flagellar M-ring protein FliF